MRRIDTASVGVFAISICSVLFIAAACECESIPAAKSDIDLVPVSSSFGTKICETNKGIDSRKRDAELEIKQEAERRAREEAAQERRKHNAICENLDGVDQLWIDAVNSKLSVLPTILIDEFRNDGWHYYCTTMNLDAVFYGSRYGGVMGTTNYDEYRILVEPRWDAMNTAVVHEMGHWYDWHLGTITSSSEFMDIYYSETNAFKNTFQIHSYYEQKELFAEAFWRFYTDNDLLAESCPRLYSFMSRVCPVQ